MRVATAAYPMDVLTSWEAYESKLRTWVRKAVADDAQLLVFPEYGAMELAPSLGLARQSVDLVSTGRTLQQNGLVETDRLLDVTARLIVNRAALKTDPRIAALVTAFRADAEEPANADKDAA